MERISIFLMISLCLGVTLSETTSVKRQTDIKDLDTEASAKFLDLGNLFNRYPYQNQYNYGGSVGRPYGSGYGYTGNIPYNTYGNRYPNTGIGYPNYGGTGYAGAGYGGGGGGFYPSNFGSGGFGTNVLGGGGNRGGYPGVVGLGGYGGYGGNGGLQSYYGYFDPEYYGSRNLGYGYYPGTNRYGFIDRPSGYRGYN